MTKLGNKIEKDRELRKKEDRTGFFAILFTTLVLILQWAYVYYQNNPLKFPWGTQVYTVSAEELNLLPNEQLNYLGTRAEQDDTTDFLYHANSMYLRAASAFSIRQGPGVYYQSIGRMYYGRDVHVIATCDDNEWYMIDFYGEEAYVHSACLFDKLPEIVTDNDDNTPIIDNRGVRIESEETDETEESEELIETEVTEETAATEVTEVTEPTETEATPTPTPTEIPAPMDTPAPTQAPAVNQPSDPTMLELFNLVNNARVQNGLTPLSWDGSLAADAAVRAQEITVVFSHTRPDGSEWWTLDTARMYGENLASGQSTAQEVFNSWWASPGHQANMLKPDFRTCGFALYYGGDAGSTYYWVQEFGY